VGLGVALGIAGVAAVVLLGGDDATPVAAPEPSVTPQVETTTQEPTAIASPQPSPSSAPAPTPTLEIGAEEPSPTGGEDQRFFTSLDDIIPTRVRGADLDSSESSDYLVDELGADEGRFLFYAGDNGTFSHLVGLFSDNRAAARALRKRVDTLVEENAATIVDDTTLQDAEGKDQGRLIEVRTNEGGLIVQWTNRNLLAVVGPEPPQRARRLYDAWPY
jgi:hypothetical protein